MCIKLFESTMTQKFTDYHAIKTRKQCMMNDTNNLKFCPSPLPNPIPSSISSPLPSPISSPLPSPLPILVKMCTKFYVCIRENIVVVLNFYYLVGKFGISYKSKLQGKY